MFVCEHTCKIMDDDINVYSRKAQFTNSWFIFVLYIYLYICIKLNAYKFNWDHMILSYD